MESIDKLLDKKMMEMQKVLDLTKKLSLTDNSEENYESLIELINEREELFVNMRKIDDQIKKMDSNASLVNNTILSVRDEIVELDKKTQVELQKIKFYLTGKIKGVKEGKKISNHFKVNAFSEGNFLDSKG